MAYQMMLPSNRNRAQAHKGAMPDRISPNCFSLNAALQLVPGVSVTTEERSHVNQRELRPHVRIGQSFVQLFHDGPRIYEGGQVYRAAAVRRERAGKNPFYLLGIPSTESKEVLLYVHAAITGHVRMKQDISRLDIWSGVRTTATVVESDTRAREFLISFKNDGEEATVFYPDGFVAKVTYQGGRLELAKLSVEEMARIRVDDAGSSLAECGSDQAGNRRRNGIIFGIIRLLHRMKQPEARTIIIEFLQKQKLSAYVRTEVRAVLIDLDDDRATDFYDDPFSNRVETPVTGKTARKRNRVINEENKTNVPRLRKGSSAGGKPALRSNEKKAAKRERKRAQRKK